MSAKIVVPNPWSRELRNGTRSVTRRARASRSFGVQVLVAPERPLRADAAVVVKGHDVDDRYDDRGVPQFGARLERERGLVAAHCRALGQLEGDPLGEATSLVPAPPGALASHAALASERVPDAGLRGQPGPPRAAPPGT